MAIAHQDDLAPWTPKQQAAMERRADRQELIEKLARQVARNAGHDPEALVNEGEPQCVVNHFYHVTRSPRPLWIAYYDQVAEVLQAMEDKNVKVDYKGAKEVG